MYQEFKESLGQMDKGLNFAMQAYLLFSSVLCSIFGYFKM